MYRLALILTAFLWPFSAFAQGSTTRHHHAFAHHPRTGIHFLSTGRETSP